MDETKTEQIQKTISTPLGTEYIKNNPTGYIKITAENEQSRKTAKIFAVILDQDSGGSFDCILVADNKKQLLEKLDALAFQYHIVGIFRGQEIKFRETKKIDFI
jgi:hypothetical protein